MNRIIQPLVFVFLSWSCNATKHTFKTRKDGRFFIGPIGSPFGFLQQGKFTLSVYDFQLSESRSAYGKKDIPKRKDEDLKKHFEAGFLLKRFATESDFAKFEEMILEDPNICSFEQYRDDTEDEEIDDVLKSDDEVFAEIDNAARVVNAGEDGIFLSMKDEGTWRRNEDNLPVPSISYTFELEEDSGLYVLMYQVCAKGTVPPFTEVRSFFELDISMHNYDSFGNVSYLTAGELPLPGIFLYFSMSYLICLLCWSKYIQDISTGKRKSSRKAHSIHSIHHMMTLLLLFKTLSVFFESVRYHYIRTTGHAELWSFVYYGLTFIKGFMLFTVILLIGSGWSFVKPFLNTREKRLILAVLILQIIDNIAVVILANETEGERLYEDWSALLHLVDILCCCAVLIPIVWQVNSLEQNLGNSNQGQEDPAQATNSRTLHRLKLFRAFYVLVVSYIYFTRVVVYLFATILSYRYTWLRHFVTELGTLAFYVIVGFKFRPDAENPYMQLVNKRDEEEESVELIGSNAADEIGEEESFIGKSKV